MRLGRGGGGGGEGATRRVGEAEEVGAGVQSLGAGSFGSGSGTEDGEGSGEDEEDETRRQVPNGRDAEGVEVKGGRRQGRLKGRTECKSWACWPRETRVPERGRTRLDERDMRLRSHRANGGAFIMVVGVAGVGRRGGGRVACLGIRRTASERGGARECEWRMHAERLVSASERGSRSDGGRAAVRMRTATMGRGSQSRGEDGRELVSGDARSSAGVGGTAAGVNSAPRGTAFRCPVENAETSCRSPAPPEPGRCVRCLQVSGPS